MHLFSSRAVYLQFTSRNIGCLEAKRPRTIGPVAARKSLTIGLVDSVVLFLSGVQLVLHFSQHG